MNEPTEDELRTALRAMQRLASGEITVHDPAFSALSIPFWTKDTRGRYLSCNSAYERLTGNKTDGLIGKTDFQITPKYLAQISQRQDLQTLTAADLLTFDIALPLDSQTGKSQGKVTKTAFRNENGTVCGLAALAHHSDMTYMGLMSVPVEQEPQQAQDQSESGQGFELTDFALAVAPYLDVFKHGGPAFGLVVLALQTRKSDAFSLTNSVPFPVLRALTERLRSKLSGRGIAYVVAADRIAIILPNVSRENVAVNIANEMCAESMYPFDVADNLYQVAAKSGTTLVQPGDATADTLMARAFPSGAGGLPAVSMFKVGSGGTDISIHQPTSEYELETDMAAGIDRLEFIAYFQPKMDLATQNVVGAEALVRWKHPKRGLIPPSMFIAMAEQIGLQAAINSQIWRQSMEFIKKLNNNSADPKRVAINISASDLQIPTFVSSINALLDETGCPASFVEFEITESALKGRSEQLEAHLAGLGELGIGLAIDDFGTGNLAFESLNRFPIQTLKIDRVFIKDVATQEKTARFVRSMCLMADDLGLATVAEGVETLMESELVKQIGCRFGQGFFWQRPVPAQQFFEWTEQRTVVQ